jgi:uncharacterized protein
MERTSYEPGVPSWVDLGADVAKAEAFYGGLFGWKAEATGTEEETGGYKQFVYKGKNVAGLGPQQNPGPPYWSTYIATTDADAVAENVKAAGGMVLVEPMDVMDVGRMAVFADPTGAVFSVWQAGAHPGAGLVNEPGSFCWSELATRDLDTAKAFYTQVFGWGVGGVPEYVEFQVDGRTIAGMMPMPDMVPDEVPPYWGVYFAVDDCEAATAKAVGLGGTHIVGPMDVEVGRFSVLTDDQGATFAVIKLKDRS